MITKLKKKFKSKKAFTLIELIVVIAIIGVLAAILIPTMNGFVTEARQATATANARTVYSVATAQHTFVTLNGGTVADGSYTSTGESTYETTVKSQLGTIDGSYTITVSGGTVTKVEFTASDAKTKGTFPN